MKIKKIHDFTTYEHLNNGNLFWLTNLSNKNIVELNELQKHLKKTIVGLTNISIDKFKKVYLEDSKKTKKDIDENINNEEEEIKPFRILNYLCQNYLNHFHFLYLNLFYLFHYLSFHFHFYN